MSGTPSQPLARPSAVPTAAAGPKPAPPSDNLQPDGADAMGSGPGGTAPDGAGPHGAGTGGAVPGPLISTRLLRDVPSATGALSRQQRLVLLGPGPSPAPAELRAPAAQGRYARCRPCAAAEGAQGAAGAVDGRRSRRAVPCRGVGGLPLPPRPAHQLHPAGAVQQPACLPAVPSGGVLRRRRSTGLPGHPARRGLRGKRGVRPRRRGDPLERHPYRHGGCAQRGEVRGQQRRGAALARRVIADHAPPSSPPAAVRGMGGHQLRRDGRSPPGDAAGVARDDHAGGVDRRRPVRRERLPRARPGRRGDEPRPPGPVRPRRGRRRRRPGRGARPSPRCRGAERDGGRGAGR
jgi:hypothetical protein